MKKQWTLPQWLLWQESAHPKVWDLGLQRIGEVWQRLNPTGEKIAPHILTIAGTNGKGSCLRWAEDICLAHGISVAAFSSPHLRDYRERMRFDGEMVTEEALISAFNAIEDVRGEISLTYFEWSTLAMFYLTQQKRVVVALLEVGLGGRLDATNLVSADAAIITRIGLDHQDWLGEDRETIGREKAGIMRQGQRVFITDDNPPASLVEKAAEVGAIVSFVGRDFGGREKNGYLSITFPSNEERFTLPLPSFMLGEHQFSHLAAVIYALSSWFPLVESKLVKVVKSTKNVGRLMAVSEKPRIIFDVAHNPDSAEVLALHVQQWQGKGGKIIAVCGMLKDKDQVAIFKIMRPVIDQWFLAALEGERGTSASSLFEHAQTAQIEKECCQVFSNVKAALTAARQNAQPSDTIVVFGSFVTVSAALEELPYE